MKDVLLKGIDQGLKRGARYLDIRYEVSSGSSVSATDGVVQEATHLSEKGVGVRVLVKGGWGFSASSVVNKKDIFQIIENAVRLAKVNDRAKIELADTKIVEDDVRYPFKKDPMKIPIEERAELCRETSKRIKEFDKSIIKSSTGLLSAKGEKIFASSEGAFIRQEKVYTYYTLGAVSRKGNTSEYYSWDDGYSKGFEVVEEYDLLGHAEDIARKAVSLVQSKKCPTKKLPVILDQNFVALLVHEIVGHPSEADRVIGKEAAWAGRAWWKGKQGEKVFSDKLTVVSDATIMGHFGSFKYDDEGVPSKKIVHIDGGVLRSFLHSRETAKVFNQEPNGSMRASGYMFAPLIRMTNTFVERGDWKFEEMLEEIKEGVYLKGEKIPSIDSRRYNFQISAKEAFMIRNGEIAEHLRSPTLTGVSPEFLSSIDAVGRDLIVFGIPNCGKGDPMQTMMVGNGGPHIRGVGMVTGPK